MRIELDRFMQDYHYAIADQAFSEEVEQAWDNVTSAWEAADDDQQRQIRQFWETYDLAAPTSGTDMHQLKKITKVIINFVALQAPEYLIDPADGRPIRI